MRARITVLLGAILLAACSAPDNGQSDLGIAPYFQDYYEQNGGIRTFGAPITVANRQDGAHVQCFQNGVLEYHPELAPAQQVFLTPLGLEYGTHQPKVDPASIPAGALYFPQTGHSVQGSFRAFFLTYGGASVFGYPISEALVESATVLVQHFERASLLYNHELPSGLKVQLAAWGQQHYDANAAACTTIDSVIIQTTPEAPVLASEPTASDPVFDFVRSVGGERIFGQPLDGADIVAEGVHVFENAVVIPDTEADGGARLMPLGLQLRGGIDPAVEPLNLPEAIFFEQTGHNVAYGFKPFFAANGGAPVFGLPISEIVVEDGRLVQYFENVRVEWYSDAPEDSKARLSNLGQKYLADVESGLQAQAIPEPSITAESWPEYPVANRDDLQTLFVRVVDEYNAPVAGAQSQMDIHTPYGVESHTLVATNEQGMSALNLELTPFDPGAHVEYEVRVQYGQLETKIQDGFDISQAAVP